MKLRSVHVAVALLAFPAAALAQGSASIAAQESRERPDYEHALRSPTTVTLSAEGNVVKTDDTTLVLDVHGKQFSVTRGKNTKLTADKKTALADKKEISLRDYPAGAPVKVTVVSETGELLEVRLRYERPKLAEDAPKPASEAARADAKAQ